MATPKLPPFRPRIVRGLPWPVCRQSEAATRDVSMTIINRRNAVVGWVTLKVGKAVAGRQAKRVGHKLAWRGGARAAARVTTGKDR